MNKSRVNSSNLASVGYDPLSQILEIDIRSGGTFQYSGVPESVYNRFMNSTSKGTFFQAFINGRYSYRML